MQEHLSSDRFLHPPFGRAGPLRAGEGFALDSMPGPPLARPSQREGEVVSDDRTELESFTLAHD